MRPAHQQCEGDRSPFGRRPNRLLGAAGALIRGASWGTLLILATLRAFAADEPEYRLKAAFLYNFAVFTEWPASVGGTLNLCVLGPDPFGADLDALEEKPVGARRIRVHREGELEPLTDCHLLFIAAPAIDRLAEILEGIDGAPVLTVADSRGAASRGAALNLSIGSGAVSFEANAAAARRAGLGLSSKLLRLATEVY